MPKATAITKKSEVGKVNADILADYATSTSNLAQGEKEIEVAFIRSCVASGVSVRDLQASIKQGQANARLAGMRVLPSITTGKVQSFNRYVVMADTMPDFHLLTVKEGLNLAQASPRLPEGFTVEGKTVEEVTSAIPPRAEKPDTGKKNRKSPARKMGIVEIVEALNVYADDLPEDLSTLPEVEILAIAKGAKRLAALKRALAA